MNILLIDDEVEFCTQARDYLVSQGHCVTVELDGNNALAQLDRTHPDVVIIDVDLGLNDIDGRSICANISQNHNYKSGAQGVIMISGHYVAPVDEVIGFEVGADNYLTKPFDLAQLSARVNAISRRIKNHDPQVLMLRNSLEILFNSRQVKVDGELVSLSRLETNVLFYLSRPPGMVRTKSELLEKVWSTPHVEEGAIAKCISVLRKKLSSDRPEMYIETVYGVGYMLIE